MPQLADLPRAISCLAGAIAEAGGGRGVGLLLIRVADHRSVALNRGVLAAQRHLDRCETLIAGVLRARDVLLRVGDADYAVVAKGISQAGQMTLAAQKLLRVVEPPIQLDEASVQVRFTVAAAVFPEHAGGAEPLFDAAMQTLEHCLRRQMPFQMHEPEIAPDTTRVWQIEQQLGPAIERGELHLNYQPKVSIATGALAGAEALMRWHSAAIGTITPDEFIAIAQRCGRIQQLTWAAVHSTLEQASRWRARSAHVPVAINLSPVCLREADFFERMQRALTIWAAAPGLLTLEVTESAMLEQVDETFALLNRLRAAGVRIAIDDFGTGYSSFQYFKLLPADELKIDKSFVSSMTKSAADHHIVEAITDLAHRFGMKVVAEGVEDAATLAALRRIGCDTAQGYLYSPAISVEKFESECIGLAPWAAAAVGAD